MCQTQGLGISEKWKFIQHKATFRGAVPADSFGSCSLWKCWAFFVSALQTKLYKLAGTTDGEISNPKNYPSNLPTKKREMGYGKRGGT
jgi:hypothetical protein